MKMFTSERMRAHRGSSLFSRSGLALIKRRAMRRRVWFKVLDRVERIILNLTIKCVARVRSPKLTGIMATIIDKLANAVKTQLKRLMEEVGRPLAQKLGRIAQNWGSVSATRWVEDHDFIQYLTVMCMNTPAMFKL